MFKRTSMGHKGRTKYDMSQCAFNLRSIYNSINDIIDNFIVNYSFIALVNKMLFHLS